MPCTPYGKKLYQSAYSGYSKRYSTAECKHNCYKNLEKPVLLFTVRT